MDKFTTNQFAEETTSAYLYELEQSHRQEEQELAEIAEAQWEAFQDDHDTEFYDWVDEGIEDELDEHDLRVAQAEWEAEMNLENDLYMVYDDPDFWG